MAAQTTNKKKEREELRRRIINILPFMQTALKQKMGKPRERSSQPLGPSATHDSTIRPQRSPEEGSVLDCANGHNSKEMDATNERKSK